MEKYLNDHVSDGYVSNRLSKIFQSHFYLKKQKRKDIGGMIQ
jgi:hypothetical protein